MNKKATKVIEEAEVSNNEKRSNNTTVLRKKIPQPLYRWYRLGRTYFNSIDFQDIFKSLLWAAIIALVFRTFFFEPFRIPSTSMLPTLKIGDFFFASKYSYGYSFYSLPVGFKPFNGRIGGHTPERGDIIVFKTPKDRYTYYIKRLIGLPGDKIKVTRGLLYINHIPVGRTYDGVYRQKNMAGDDKLFLIYKETLPNGIQYQTLDANVDNHRSFPDTTEEYEVPAGHYFLMGDNRNNSTDSRYLKEMGFIPEENIVGKAYFMFWTSDFTFKDLFTNFSQTRVLKVIG